MVEALLSYQHVATRSIAEVIGLLPPENEGITDIGDAVSTRAGGVAYTFTGDFKSTSPDVLSCKFVLLG